MQMKKSTLVMLLLGIFGAVAGAIMAFYSAWLVYSLPLKEMQGESLVFLAIGTGLAIWVAVHILDVAKLRSMLTILGTILVGLYLQYSFMNHVKSDYLQSLKPKPAVTAPAPKADGTSLTAKPAASAADVKTEKGEEPKPSVKK